jgi:hypothetical protein
LNGYLSSMKEYQSVLVEFEQSMQKIFKKEYPSANERTTGILSEYAQLLTEKDGQFSKYLGSVSKLTKNGIGTLSPKTKDLEILTKKNLSIFNKWSARVPDGAIKPLINEGLGKKMVEMVKAPGDRVTKFDSMTVSLSSYVGKIPDFNKESDVNGVKTSVKSQTEQTASAIKKKILTEVYG